MRIVWRASAQTQIVANKEIEDQQQEEGMFIKA